MALSEPREGETNWSKWVWDDVAAEGLKKALDAQTVPLRLEFESLSYMLLQYELHQGSQVVIDFYKYRFAAVLVSDRLSRQGRTAGINTEASAATTRRPHQRSIRPASSARRTTRSLSELSAGRCR